jgi:hypothetical protein
MQIGYSAPYNEDCEIRYNHIFRAGLTINKYRKVVNEKNEIRPTGQKVAPGLEKPPIGDSTMWAPNRYDRNRFHLAIAYDPVTSPTGKTRREVRVSFITLKEGDKYCLLDPRDFYGKPVAEGTVKVGKSLVPEFSVPMKAEFAAFVVVKQP